MGSSAPPAAALGFVCFPTLCSAAPAAALTPAWPLWGFFGCFFWPPLAPQHITCEVAGVLQAGGCALHPSVLAGTCKRAGGCAGLLPPPLPPPHMAWLSQLQGRERLIQQLLPPNLTLTSKQSPLLAHPAPNFHSAVGCLGLGSAPRRDGRVCLGIKGCGR